MVAHRLLIGKKVNGDNVLFSELSPKNISSSINIHTLSVQAIGASDLRVD